MGYPGWGHSTGTPSNKLFGEDVHIIFFSTLFRAFAATVPQCTAMYCTALHCAAMHCKHCSKYSVIEMGIIESNSIVGGDNGMHGYRIVFSSPGFTE